MPSSRFFGATFAVAFASAFACSGDEQPPPPPPVTFGSAVIAWTLIDQAGNSLTCEELTVSLASVSLGSVTLDQPCGEEQRLSFTRVTPGRYGVTLRLEAAGRGVLVTKTANIDVVANQEVVLEIPVEIDVVSLNYGSIFFTWTVAGGEPQANCSAVEGRTVHFQTTPTSSSQFTRDEDCTVGEALFDQIPMGVYEVQAELRDLSGMRIGSLQQFQLQVRSGERSEESIAFFQTAGEPSSFHGVWTISSSVAADRCEDLEADRVRVSLQTLPVNQQGVEIASATVACDIGELTIDELLGGTNQVRATFVLISDFLGVLATETSTSFFLVPGRTSTVSIDFEVQ